MAGFADGRALWQGEHDRLEGVQGKGGAAAAARQLLHGGLQAAQASALGRGARLLQLRPRKGIEDLGRLAGNARQPLEVLAQRPLLPAAIGVLAGQAHGRLVGAGAVPLLRAEVVQGLCVAASLAHGAGPALVSVGRPVDGLPAELL